MGQPVISPEELTKHVAYDVMILRFVTMFATGYMLSEWVMFLPYEYRIWKRLLWERKSCPISHYVLLGIRWSIISTIFPVFIFFFGRPSNCTATLVLVWATFTVCWAFCSLLFVLRVAVIWSYDRRVMAFFGILWLGCLGVWVAVTSTFRGAYIPETPAPQPWCAQADPSPWRGAGWGANMVFDICILAFTAYKLCPGARTSTGASTNMRRFILKSNLWYFVGSVFAETVCFTLQLSISNIDIAQSPSPITFALTPILAARIVYASMDHNQNSIMNQNNFNCKCKDIEHGQRNNHFRNSSLPISWRRESSASTNFETKIIISPPVSSSSHQSKGKPIAFQDRIPECPLEVCESKTNSLEMTGSADPDWIPYNGTFTKQRVDSSDSSTSLDINTPPPATTPRVDVYTTTVRSEPDVDFEQLLQSGKLGWTRHPDNF